MLLRTIFVTFLVLFLMGCEEILTLAPAPQEPLPPAEPVDLTEERRILEEKNAAADDVVRAFREEVRKAERDDLPANYSAAERALKEALESMVEYGEKMGPQKSQELAEDFKRVYYRHWGRMLEVRGHRIVFHLDAWMDRMAEVKSLSSSGPSRVTILWPASWRRAPSRNGPTEGKCCARRSTG